MYPEMAGAKAEAFEAIAEIVERIRGVVPKRAGGLEGPRRDEMEKLAQTARGKRGSPSETDTSSGDDHPSSPASNG